MKSGILGPGVRFCTIVLVTFALPFGFFVGLLGVKGPAVDLACGVTGALLALAVHRFLQRSARATPRPPVTQAELLRGREEIAARIEAFANEPRNARWAPLIRRFSVTSPAHVEGWERRYQEILADPKRRHHAASMLEGDPRTDRQLDYADDPSMLCTCVHLQPVERAIRAMPVKCEPLAGPDVVAAVTVDFGAVKGMFATPDCVVFIPFVPRPHASHEDVIHCSACDSDIVATTGTRFPQSP